VFATGLNLFFGYDISVSNFTLVGMSGVMSGVLHAPLTAMFLIAEITSGYELFVPLMLVVAISYTTSTIFEKHSLYTKHLIERGDLIKYDKDKQVLSLIDIKKIVEKDLLTVQPDATLEELVSLVKISKRNIFPVVNDDGGLDGIVTLDDIRDVMFDTEQRSAILVKSIMRTPPAEVAPRESMQSVMGKFEVTAAWNLPVIENGKYIGFLSKSRIFNTYRTKLKRQNQE
jgi:CIC family chloride channel protein